jgi:hypothetical protein
MGGELGAGDLDPEAIWHNDSSALRNEEDLDG